MPLNESERGQKRYGFALVARLLGITGNGLSFWEVLSVVAFVIGAAVVVCFATPFDSGWARRFGLLFAIGSGAWMGGGALGFLFGIPRYKSDAADNNHQSVSPEARMVMAFSPNTNLEQISDWLTKVIVGATLVQLGAIARGFAGLCIWIGQQISLSSAAAFCGGILIYFFFAGFMWGYLWCSIRIFRELVQLTARLRDGS